MDLKGRIVIWDALNTQKETVEEKRYYISSLPMDVELFYW